MKENEKIASGCTEGVEIEFNTLGIINGIIDEAIQAPYYPEFARHNTYGIEAVCLSSTLFAPFVISRVILITKIGQ